MDKAKTFRSHWRKYTKDKIVLSPHWIKSAIYDILNANAEGFAVVSSTNKLALYPVF